MDLFHEYALLVAVAIPFLVLVGLNVFLWLAGERGTLILPSSRTRPAASQMIEAEALMAPPIDRTPPANAGSRPAASEADGREPANDPQVRDAA